MDKQAAEEYLKWIDEGPVAFFRSVEDPDGEQEWLGFKAGLLEELLKPKEPEPPVSLQVALGMHGITIARHAGDAGPFTLTTQDR